MGVTAAGIAKRIAQLPSSTAASSEQANGPIRNPHNATTQFQSREGACMCAWPWAAQADGQTSGWTGGWMGEEMRCAAMRLTRLQAGGQPLHSYDRSGSYCSWERSNSCSSQWHGHPSQLIDIYIALRSLRGSSSKRLFAVRLQVEAPRQAGVQQTFSTAEPIEMRSCFPKWYL